MTLSLSIENILGVIAIILTIVASHVHLISRLTRLETKEEDRQKADDEWRRRVEDRIGRLEERRA